MTESCRATHASPLPIFSILASAAWPAVALFAVLALIVIGGPGAQPAAAADAPAGQLVTPKPPEFTAEDAKALQAAQFKLLDIQGALLNEKVSADDSRRLTTEGVTLTMLVRSLQAKKQAWEEYAKSQAIPVGSAPQLSKLYETLLKYRTLYRRQFRIKGADDLGPGPEPLGQEWESIANDLEPFTRLPMTIGKTGTARYAMRALLVRGEALVYASVAYYRKKETAKQLDCYTRGCAALEAASHPAEEGAIGVVWLDREQTLETPEYPYSGAELAGADDPSKYPVVLQMKSCDRARQVLAEFCPWGARTYAALAQAGILEGLDWRILLPYTEAKAQPGEKTKWPNRSLLDYFAGYGREYLGEHTMSKGPSSIEADFKAFQSGEFQYDGKKVKIKWRHAPKDVTYTVWVVSPMLSGVITSDIVGYITDAAQYLTEGFEALVLDHIQDAMIEAIDTETDAPVYTSTSTIGDIVTPDNLGIATTMKALKKVDMDLPGVISEPVPGKKIGITYIVKKAKAVKAQIAKDNWEAVLGLVEQAEMAVLFESIDPRNDEIHKLVGDPKTYDGAQINPIIIRAYATGWEDTGDDRYPRQWHYFRYYEFDPRALSGVEDYNLSQEDVKELPHLKEFLANDPAVQREVWKLLPDKPKHIGTRLYITEATPDMQELEITVGKETLADWMKKNTHDTAVVATIKVPEPCAGEYVMGPLDGSKDVSVAFALVASGVDEYAPFLKKVAWHARMQLPTLFKEYQVRILVCRKGRDVLTGNALYYFNERDAYELASFPVRFASVKGKPATGKHRLDLGGETFQSVVVMNQPCRVIQAPKAEAAPSGSPVLPCAVVVDTLYMTNGVMSAHDTTEFDLKAYVSPVEPGDYHATVQIGSYTYHMWAHVEGRGAAAAFSASIPAPPGRNTVTVSCQGAQPATFTLERNPGKPNFEWANGEIAKAQQRMSEASDAQSQRSAMISYWEASVGMASVLITAGQYNQAEQYAAAVLEKGPPAQAFNDNESDAARWMGIRTDAAKQLLDAAYRAGDTGTASNAAAAYVKEMTDETLYRIAVHRYYSSEQLYPFGIAFDYATAIRKAMTAGVAPGALSGLRQGYLSWRQKMGSKYPQYDSGLIIYGREGGGQ